MGRRGSRGTISDYTPAKLRKTISDAQLQLGAEDITISDDKKIKFGDNNDAHIEYNENGDDFLVISGSSKGVVLSGSTIQIAGTLEGASPLKIGSEMQFVSTGSSAAFKFGPDQNAKIYYSGAHSDNQGNVSDMLVISGTANGGVVISGSHAIIDSSLTIRGNIYSHGDVTVNAQDSVSLDPANNVILNPGIKTISQKNLQLVDDRRLYFGSDDDSFIEYDEAGDDHLIISGSSQGIVLSGSNVKVDGALSLGTLAFDGASGKILLSDNEPLALDIAEGSNSYIKFSTTDNNERILIYKETRVTDDVKLKFGTNGDAHIEYNENGDDHLVISGSSQGIVLSGSSVSISGTLKVSETLEYREDSNTNITFGSGDMSFVADSASFGIQTYDTLLGTSQRIAVNTNTASVDFLIYKESSTTPSLFISSSDGVIHSNYGLTLHDDKKLYFGSNEDAYIEYDQDATSQLIINGRSGSVGIGSSDNVILQPSNEIRLTPSDKTVSYSNFIMQDDKKLYFGTNSSSYIEYDADGDDLLVISGSSEGLKLAGSKIVLDTSAIASGSLANTGSYLGINAQGQLVLTSSLGSGNGSLQLAAGNNISLNTDENGLVTISYLPAYAGEPIPDDDSEAASIVTGGALYWRAGSGYRMSLHSTGFLGVGVTGSANVTHRITLPDIDGPAGQIRANGFVSYSTKRLKKDIKPLQNSLEVIKNLQGVSYKWKKSGRKDYGFIAEDVGKILPGIVQWEDNGKDATSMDYIKIISFLVEAVKEQQNQIETLNQRLGLDDKNKS